MPSFVLPSIQDSAFRTFVSLTVQADFALPSASLREIRKQLSFDGEAFHVSFRQAVTLARGPAQLEGMLGLHDFPGRKGAVASRRDRYLHYSLELYPFERPKSAGQEAWDDAAARISSLVSQPHAATAVLVQRVSQTASLAARLPIPIASTDSPGFSEIRGVRLAKQDPERPGKELYSVVLDKGQSRIVVTANCAILASWSDDLMCMAYERAASVANLAAWEES